MADRLDYVRHYFHDEAPELGCGQRRVLIVAVDDRQVTVIEPSTCCVATVSRLPTKDDVYPAGDALLRATPLGYFEDALAAKLCRVADETGRYTPVLGGVLRRLGLAESDLPEPLRHQQGTTPLTQGASGEPIDTSETPLPGEKGGDFVKRLWMMARFTPKGVADMAASHFPTRKINVGQVNWYVNRMIKEGVQGVPPWPRGLH